MKNIELYFFPSSFYSQRARLSLEEKGIKYKERIICLPDNEHNQPWFLKVNPNGEVPTLRVGNEYFSESEKIVDIADKLPSDIKHTLVPFSNSPEGQHVAFWRKKIDDLDIRTITFGVSVYPDFTQEKPTESIMQNAQGVKDRFEKSIRESKTLMNEHPELKEMYERKIRLTKQRLIDFFDKEKITTVLVSTDTTMAEIEQQLCKMADASGLRGADYFLCGESFTAADINLCILLGRFKVLGILPRFTDPKKYPNLNKYWQRLQKRPSVEKVIVNNVAETKRFMFCRKIRRYCGAAAAFGVVGVAVWLAYRHLNR